MGYAGYVPAKLAPEKPTDLQAALWQARSLVWLHLSTYYSHRVQGER